MGRRVDTIRVTWTDDPDEIESLCDELYDDHMYMSGGLMKEWYKRPWCVDNITYAHLGDQILGVLIVFTKSFHRYRTGTYVPRNLRRQHIGTLLYREHKRWTVRRRMKYSRWNTEAAKFYNSVEAP